LPRLRLLLLLFGCLSAVVIVAGASAGPTTIEPRTHVHGMLVVQGTGEQGTEPLLGVFCRPDIPRTGRYLRTCTPVPRVSRLFVGYGIFAPQGEIDRSWRASTWSLWIDGRRIALDAFGTADRTLYRYPPAGRRDVTLREWTVTLLRPTPGRHTLRYRIQVPHGAVDATWTFTVAR
jgi:hypothetical protein